MAIAYVIYAIALAFVVSIAVSLMLYGAIDYVRDASPWHGVMEALAGAVVFVYLLIFHAEGLTYTIPRELTHGSLASKAYIVMPMVLGLVVTDYLLRRIIPLVDTAVGYVTDDSAREEPIVGRHSGTRRSVLGVALGLLATSQIGGLGLLEDILRSPTPAASEISDFQEEATFEAPYFPTALTFTEDGGGYVASIEGRIFRFEHPSPDQESLSFTEVASGIQFPHGLEVHDDTLYTVDNGDAASGKYDVEEGYEVLQDSNGEVIAYDIQDDGGLGARRTVISGLPVVNRDHALHQISTGPEGRLHLSIGHLGGQKYPELFEDGAYAPTEENHPGIEYLGTVIAFEPDGSDIEIVARGLRNVYDITFDQQGNLFGANNDGMSTRSKVWESLCHITEGAHFGYPEYGTFDDPPADTTVRDPLWILDGLQSTGVETTDTFADRDGVVVGLRGKVVFVPIERGEDSVYVPEFLRTEPTVIEMNDDPIILEASPDGYLWVGSTGRYDRLTLYSVDS
jgi:glucose/arabinose dehydrogenase